MQAEEAPQGQLQLANEFILNGKLRSAIRTYRMLYNSEGGIDACLGLYSVLEKAGRHAMSQKVEAFLTSTYPENIHIRLQLAKTRLESAQYPAAWRQIQACLTINPECTDAWEQAYACASQLEKHEVCEGIAKKLLSLAPVSAKYHELLALSLTQQHKPVEACKAYERAHKYASSDIVYFINAKLPFWRIFPAGTTACELAAKITKTAEAIDHWLESGNPWELRSDRGLTNSVFYTAYSPFNLRKIFQPYLSALSRAIQPFISAAINESKEMAARLNVDLETSHRARHHNPIKGASKIRLGIASQHFYLHSNSLAFEGLLKHLDRDIFSIILIHGPGTVSDSVHAKLNGWAGEIVYLSDSLPHVYLTLKSLDLDILFFTDIGMSPLDLMIPALRACDIQITGWGLPHTTGLQTIDYYLSSSLLETDKNANEYTENLALLEGLPCCFLSENLHYQKRPKHYFMLPNDRLAIGCVQTLFKIHPDMDLVLERIANRLPDAVFTFATFSDYLDKAFLTRLEKRAPNAAKRTILLSRCANADFLALCDCLDIILDTPYYGAGVTAYMSTYVGTPMVCFSGSRLRDSTTAAIYRYLSIANAPIVHSIPEYVDKVVELATDFDLRFQIKKDTVEAAHRLYDNQEYIRSFEEFCLNLLGRS